MFLCFKKFPKIDVKKSEGKPLFKNISNINVKKNQENTHFKKVFQKKQG